MDERLPEENPSLYGLHPNAEIEFMTGASNTLFNTLLELQCRDSVGEEAAQSVEEKVENTHVSCSYCIAFSIYFQIIQFQINPNYNHIVK